MVMGSERGNMGRCFWFLVLVPGGKVLVCDIWIKTIWVLRYVLWCGEESRIPGKLAGKACSICIVEGWYFKCKPYQYVLSLPVRRSSKRIQRTRYIRGAQ
jgi:hypothetical protein